MIQRVRRALAIAGMVAMAGCHGLKTTGEKQHSDVAHRYDVSILRDTWGVPHIFGITDADAAYGLAYAHAEDDFETIQKVLLAGRGTLASVLGREFAANDYAVHLLRISDTVNANYESLSTATQHLLEGYAAGLNDYARRHTNKLLDTLFPVTAKDVVMAFAMKMPFFYGLYETLTKLYDERAPVRSSLADARGSVSSQ